MGTMLKTWRHTLRDNYYKRYQSDAERLANVPPLVKREQWKEFVTNESTIDAQKKSETGKLNRSKIGATHTSGRNGQAQVEYNLKQKKTDDKPDPTRVDVWIESHSHKDGTVPKSLAPVVDQVKTKKRELESTSSNSQSQSLLDDALSHVFGKDTRGRTRGVGSTVPRSSIEASMPAIYLLENEIAEGKEMKGRLHNLETYVKDMNSNISNELSTIKSLLSSTMGKQSQFMAGNGVNATPGASSSSNMDHSLLDGVSCDIKGFNGKVIGKGRIDSSPREMMHGHIIDFKEEIVLIVDTVLDANALLYLGQQGGAENLGDICSGGWIVWPKSLVKRIR